MKKKDLLKYVGSMQQLAYVRPVTGCDGRNNGLNMLEMKNGELFLRLLPDKCLDIGELSYRGTNFQFLSKPGLQGRNHYDTNGDEAIRSIMGGFLFTCGLENICAPCTLDGVDYPMHGRIRTTPAEHVCQDAFWEGDSYVLRASGEMREAALFGENLVLRRTVETVYGSKTFTIRDVIENEAYRDEPLMLLYHMNLGYPFLDENTRIYLKTSKVTPRDEESKGHEDEYDRMDPPRDNEPEYVFIHDIIPDDKGNCKAVAVNEALKLGIKIEWNNRHLPYFMEWKTTASGDYALGLEAANSSVYGRPFHNERGDLHTIGPFDKEENLLTFTILEGEDEINEAVK